MAEKKEFIRIRGARENNLKALNVDIPRNQFVVFTGLSGSGKSSLAFDTIYAEGQRRYMESLSSYARQFLGQMEKPNVDSIEGLPPAISIDQKSTNRNPRSTVGTVTEIYDYFRLLYARIGIPHCPKCGKVISRQSVDQMVDQIMALPERTKIQLLAPVVRGRKGRHEKVLEQAKRSGYVRVMIDGSHLPFEENIALTRKVVEYAHDRNVTVEAELGRLAGVEDDVKVSAEDSSYTRPEEVEEFATRTGCDSLAIAIGTSHGAFKFKGEPKLRFDILEEVSKRLPGFPIVLHGASSVIPSYVDMINKYGGNMPGAQGVPEEMLRKAASMAVCKINIDSDLRLAFTGEIRKHLAEHPDHFDPRQYLTDARNGIREMVRHKIVDVLGCNGKA